MLILTAAIVLLLAVAPLAQGRSWHVTVPHRHLTLTQRIHWQRKVIKHDLWVIRTRKSHRVEVTRWHRKQLRWTRRELHESLNTFSLLHVSQSSSDQLPTLSGVCLSCWDNVATCESTNNWQSVSKPYDSAGDTFKGGLQFTDETWRNSGGTRYASTANLATRLQQIAIASKLALSNWPVCGARY